MLALWVFVDLPTFDIPSLLPTIQKIVDIIWKLTASGGVVIGGTWAYYKLIKGRTFRPNLVAKVAGETRNKNGDIYLIATTEIENVGTSKVNIDRDLTLVRVLTAKPIQGNEEGPIEWMPFRTTRILGHHTYLEPGETAVDTELFQIRNEGYIALRLEVHVTSSSRTLSGGVPTWVGIGIVNLAEGVDNTVVSGEGS